MKLIKAYIADIHRMTTLEASELESALESYARVRPLLAEDVVTALDDIVDDLLRYKYKESVRTAVLKNRKADQ